MTSRPKTFRDFVGMTDLKKLLRIMISAAQQRNCALDHIILYGPPGLGKTTMAHLVSKYSQQPIKCVNGHTIAKKADVLTIFTTLKKNDILFIDEIHAVGKQAEELLFSAMEDNVIDVVIGVTGDAKIVRFKLPQFTIVGATTNFGEVTQALLDRFGLAWRFNYYTLENLVQIIKLNLTKTSYSIQPEAANHLASFAHFTPRTVNFLLNRIIDFLVVKKTRIITKKIVCKVLKILRIYELGLNEHHVAYLRVLANTFNKKYASLNLISHLTQESKSNIFSQIEPALVKHNLIEKNTCGRRITIKGIKYIRKIKK